MGLKRAGGLASIGLEIESTSGPSLKARVGGGRLRKGGEAMTTKLGWGLTFWMVAALALICASASHVLNVPVLLPALLGLGVPTAVLFWLHREHLHQELNMRKR